MTSLVTRLVFAAGMIVIGISYASILFPAIMTAHVDVSKFGIADVGPDRYEPGVWTMPVIAVILATILLVILYKTGIMPRVIISAFNRMRQVEVSRKTAGAILGIILASYAAASIQELSGEEQWEDYIRVSERLDSWSLDQIDTFEPHVRYFLIKSSEDIFGNQKAIPFIASILLLLVIYDLTRIMTNKRVAGIVAMAIMMQSGLFLRYDTSVTYTNFWVLFYMVSLYATYRAWPLAPVAYLISIPSKALTIAFVPMSVYYILRSPIRRRTKAIVAGSIVGIISGGAVFATGTDPTTGGNAIYEGFSMTEFQTGFASFATQLGDDGLLVLFMIPLVVGLYYTSRINRHAESVIIFIAGMFLLAPVLVGFTDQTNQPYRFMPLVVFFAIGVGMLLSSAPVQAKPD